MQTKIYFFNEDSKILNALRHGNDHVLVDVFYQNRNSVASLILRNHGTEDDVEDVLQEAVVILWERVHQGTFEYQSKLSTFIYATAKNIWLRRLSKKKRELPVSEAAMDVEDPDPNPLDELETNERAAAVQRAMEQLGNPCHDLLLLYYWEERSMEEIAHQLGFANADTVKSKKYQCKKVLGQLTRKLLGGNHA